MLANYIPEELLYERKGLGSGLELTEESFRRQGSPDQYPTH